MVKNLNHSFIELFQLESLDLDASGKSAETSVSRSSSLIANLSGYDDDDNETHDMSIIVDDPEKHSGTMDAYITFRVTLKVCKKKRILHYSSLFCIAWVTLEYTFSL